MFGGSFTQCLDCNLHLMAVGKGSKNIVVRLFKEIYIYIGFKCIFLTSVSVYSSVMCLVDTGTCAARFSDTQLVCLSYGRGRVACLEKGLGSMVEQTVPPSVLNISISTLVEQDMEAPRQRYWWSPAYRPNLGGPNGLIQNGMGLCNYIVCKVRT